MRTKLYKLTLLSAVVLALGVVPAIATSTTITLGSSSQGTTFIGTGSSDSVQMDLGSCTGGSCELTGVAKGTGLFASKGAYDITSPSNIELDLTNSTTGLWTADSNGDTIEFSYGPGGSLLTGYLNLLQFQQIPSKVSGSQNWYLTSASLTVTGGSLDIAKGDQLNLVFNNVPAHLNSLLGPSGSGSTIVTSFGHGTLSPTPEAGSILLLGIGLLFVGTVLRTRLSRGSQHS